jgi:hypothetical protein
MLRSPFIYGVLSCILLVPLSASAEVLFTECRQLECSGRQIACGNKGPVDKIKCEADKSKWKANCEAKKQACFAVEGKF